MAQGADSPQGAQTPDAIVGEIEVTREQLALTIDLLVDRTSPKNVAWRTLADVKARFVQPDGSPRVDALAKVGGAALGVVVVVVLLRRVVGGS
ncbi:MAG: DUF3618 domain-containing protein [Actinomycetota bacterium]|nr:DUF3618 domain-containing protein [Actinomycetota bacterium]